VAAVGYAPLASLPPLYPGDRYVDVVGLDGYNWGATQSWSRWQSVDEIFNETVTAVRKLTRRSIIITETASAEVGGDKAEWIKSVFTWLIVHPEVEALVWFNHNKETDWRIESSESATQAFASAWAATVR
jgi:beta-mannanase